jgi:hypothetical protein
MSNIEKERKEYKIFSNITIFITVIFLVLVLFQLGFVYFGIKDPDSGYSWTQYFIEYGDSYGALLSAFTLALFLIQLNSARGEHIQALEEAEKDRQLLMQENKKERRVSHLIKQLGFYSKLIGKISVANVPELPKNRLIKDFRNKMREDYIQEEYQIWSSKTLYSSLEIWFRKYHDEGNAQFIRNKEGITEDEFIESTIILINNIEVQAKIDFSKIQKEYRILTEI